MATKTVKTAPVSTDDTAIICACGVPVLSEVDPRDGLIKKFVFDSLDDGSDEPSLRLWVHTCPSK